MTDPAEGYFRCSTRDRAVFELGIKMGAIVHQFSGTPIGPGNVRDIERAMERTIMEMPFVTAASVKIKDPVVEGEYAFSVLGEDMLDINITVNYSGVIARGRMRYIESLGYPLMYIEGVDEDA